MEFHFVWSERKADFVQVFSDDWERDPDFVNNTVTITFVEKGGVLFDVKFKQVFGDVLGKLESLAAQAHSLYGKYGETIDTIERVWGSAV